MKATRFFGVVLVLTLMVVLAGAAGAQEPQQAGNGGCNIGDGYDPACDVNRDGDTDIQDLQLVAANWGRTGIWTSDVWLTTGNPNTDPNTHFLGTTDGQDLIINPNGGNVGIGTTLLTRGKLQVHDGSIVSSGASGGTLIALNPNNQNASVNLSWDTTDGTKHWPRIRYGGTGQGAATGLLIQGQGDSTKLAILDSGKVGIGTREPGEKLDVNGNAVVRQFLLVGITSTVGYKGVTADSNDLIVSGQLAVGGSGGAAMYKLGVGYGPPDGGEGSLNVAGNVGIGTTDPDDTLDVVGTLDVSGRAYLNGIVLDDDADITGADKIVGHNDLRLYGDSIDGPDLHIKAGGNVGIGTTNPGNYRLAVKEASSSSGHGLRILNADESKSAQLWVGTGGAVLDAEGTTNLHLRTAGADRVFIRNSDGYVGIGTTSPQTKLDVNGTSRTKVLQITGGSDLAEPFEIIGAENVEPGIVVSIDPQHPGQLRIADKAYDRMVAGCVSGANGLKPGLVMQQEGSAAAGAFPVALSGRVYCWADASYGPIQPGDLLTTSDRAGHVMKVTDYQKAQGAIIGKAMSALEEAQGLVLVLVSLQ